MLIPVDAGSSDSRCSRLSISLFTGKSSELLFVLLVLRISFTPSFDFSSFEEEVLAFKGRFSEHTHKKVMNLSSQSDMFFSFLQEFTTRRQDFS